MVDDDEFHVCNQVMTQLHRLCRVLKFWKEEVCIIKSLLFADEYDKMPQSQTADQPMVQ